MSIKVAIIGATGLVGQKVIALFEAVPDFEVIELVASDQRIGMKYKEAVEWREPLIPFPPNIGEITLKAIHNLEAPFIISCLPYRVAKEIEPYLASQGKIVFSNAAAFRMHPNVPLLVPEINTNHLCLLEKQKTKGKIITNPNCSAVGVTLALAPLLEIGIIRHVSVVTLQSISGAGYPGLSAMDLIGNTIPHIEHESEKINEEVPRICGTSETPANFTILTQVHRVPVLYGHTVTLHIHFDQIISKEKVIEAYHQWNKKFPNLFIIHEQLGYPQPLLNLTQNDQRAHIGHITTKGNIVGLICLTHNLVRGAAGAVISNMLAYINYKPSFVAV